MPVTKVVIDRKLLTFIQQAVGVVISAVQRRQPREVHGRPDIQFFEPLSPGSASRHPQLAAVLVRPGQDTRRASADCCIHSVLNLAPLLGECDRPLRPAFSVRSVERQQRQL